jgi:hypothetical protein
MILKLGNRLDYDLDLMDAVSDLHQPDMAAPSRFRADLYSYSRI